MKKIIFVFLLFILFFIGCSLNSGSEITEIIQFTPDTTNVKTLGRTYLENNELWLGHTDSGIEFKVSAKYLEIKITGDKTATGFDNGTNARIVAFLDGERILDSLILNKDSTFTLFNSKETINGIVRIIKVSECATSLTAIKSIGINNGGTISPTKPAKIKIEFLGDSITCGYGVDSPSFNFPFMTNMEDGSKTYAYKTALYFDADYSVVSLSGWGVYSGYTSNGERNESDRVPLYYDKFCYNSFDTINGKTPQSIDWKFTEFRPDYVVINLGSNDSTYTLVNSEERNIEFINAYVDFLKVIRSKNPGSHIVCSMGIMGQHMYQPVIDAVKLYQSKVYDENISTLKFDVQSPEDGYGAGLHPNEITHTKASEKLISHIINQEKRTQY